MNEQLKQARAEAEVQRVLDRHNIKAPPAAIRELAKLARKEHQ